MKDRIEVRGISKQVGGRQILDNISFTLPGGSVSALLGQSGCGKSTLLNLLAGFDTPSAGKVWIGGEEVAGPNPHRVLLFQDGALLPWRTALENVAFGLEAIGARRKSAKERAYHYLEQVGLGAFGQSLPAELSGGQRQRVALARALATEPRTIFLDEPFSALDTLTRERLQDLLLQLAERLGATIVLVTHDVEEALYLADQCLIFAPEPGRIVDTIDVDGAKPRQRGGRDVIELKERILARLSANWGELAAGECGARGKSRPFAKPVAESTNEATCLVGEVGGANSPRPA